MRFATVRALAPIDFKSVRRDPLLRWLIFYPLAITLLVRWGLPLAEAHLSRQFDFDLLPYYPLLLSFLLLMTPMLAGMVIGFLLLDQRDDQTLSALRVTPLTLAEYLTYLMAVPVVLSFLVSLFVLPGVGLVQLSFAEVLLSSLAAAPLAPLYALSLAALASNKVQGFALAKAFGVFSVPPVIAYFIETPWQWLFGIVPLYWPAKVVWQFALGSLSALSYLVIGLFYECALLALLLKHFRTSLHSGKSL